MTYWVRLSVSCGSDGRSQSRLGFFLFLFFFSFFSGRPGFVSTGILKNLKWKLSCHITGTVTISVSPSINFFPFQSHENLLNLIPAVFQQNAATHSLDRSPVHGSGLVVQRPPVYLFIFTSNIMYDLHVCRSQVAVINQCFGKYISY